MPDSFKNRLLEAMNKNDIKASELSKRTGLSKAQISQYVNGVYEAKQAALYKLAVALNVSEPWLMGHDVPMGRLLQSKVKEQASMIEQVKLYFGAETAEAVNLFAQLNENGKRKAIENLQDLTAIEKYTTAEKVYNVKIAARNGEFKETTITESELQRIKNLPDAEEF